MSDVNSDPEDIERFNSDYQATIQAMSIFDADTFECSFEALNQNSQLFNEEGSTLWMIWNRLLTRPETQNNEDAKKITEIFLKAHANFTDWLLKVYGRGGIKALMVIADTAPEYINMRDADGLCILDRIALPSHLGRVYGHKVPLCSSAEDIYRLREKGFRFGYANGGFDTIWCRAKKSDTDTVNAPYWDLCVEDALQLGLSATTEFTISLHPHLGDDLPPAHIIELRNYSQFNGESPDSYLFRQNEIQIIENRLGKCELYRASLNQLQNNGHVLQKIEIKYSDNNKILYSPDISSPSKTETIIQQISEHSSLKQAWTRIPLSNTSVYVGLGIAALRMGVFAPLAIIGGLAAVAKFLNLKNNSTECTGAIPNPKSTEMSHSKRINQIVPNSSDSKKIQTICHKEHTKVDQQYSVNKSKDNKETSDAALLLAAPVAVVCPPLAPIIGLGVAATKFIHRMNNKKHPPKLQ